MKNLLYVGNYLQNKKTNKSYMHTLGAMLQSEAYIVKFTSSRNNKIYRFWDMIWSFFIHKSKTDYVLIDTYSTQNFYYAFVISQLSRFFKIKYVPILHGGNLPERIKRSTKLSNAIFKNAHINVSPSLYLKKIFEEYGYSNIIYIPNTLEIETYFFKQREYKKIGLLWVRSFSKIYNPKMAISVFKNVLDKGYNAELCMVGPDSDGSLQEVKHYAKALNVDVKFTGKLSKKKWIELSQDYNIFINTTNFDNAPISVMEAMAIGIPVISTNVGGIPFLINNGVDGLCVHPDNTEEMAESIIKLFTNSELAGRLAVNARKKVESFDWKTIKYHWINILQ